MYCMLSFWSLTNRNIYIYIYIYNFIEKQLRPV